MDARAYLQRQGWRGSGHSLDKHDRGIKKPLLISHKQDTMGLGKKKAAHTTDDQWWMRAFDESLKNIGTGQESTLSQVRKVGISRGGLYGFFVKGEGLHGTMGETEVVSTTAEASTSQSSTSTSRQSTPPTSINSDTAADRSSKKKRKRNEEASNEDSKRRKEYKGKTASSKKRTRDEAVSDQTCDLDPEKVRKTWERIDRDVKIQIKRDEKAGRYIQLPSEKTATIPDPENPGKKLSYKGARIRRQKSLRTATKELKKKMVVDAMMEGELPNPKGYTWQEALQNFDKDIKALKKAGAPKRGTVRETKTNSKEEKPPKTPSRATDDSKAAVAAKVAKLTALEKTQYEERAKAKNQTLEQYVLRRIEKKSEKKQGADSSSISATETPLPAVVDVQNDKNLVATTISKAEMSKKVASKKKVIRTVKVRTEVAVTA